MHLIEPSEQEKLKIKMTNSKPLRTALVVMTLLSTKNPEASMLRPGGSKDDTVQVEDYIVMQMEMAWGVKEMSRYKKHRGEWPTRSSSNYDDTDETDEFLAEIQRQQEEKTKGVRGRPEAIDKLEAGEGEEEQGSALNQTEQVNNDSGEQLFLDNEVDDDMVMLLRAKNAARTVEEYWNTLVSLF
jgi:hypothetical protein